MVSYMFVIPRRFFKRIYDGHTAYRQLIREGPLLMVRVVKNVEFLIHTAKGRVPLAGPRPGRN